MNNCETCTYWHTMDHDEGMTGRMGNCDCPLMLYGYRTTASEEIKEKGAIIEDDEGWGMYTGKNFGCVHWRNK